MYYQTISKCQNNISIINAKGFFHIEFENIHKCFEKILLNNANLPENLLLPPL